MFSKIFDPNKKVYPLLILSPLIEIHPRLIEMLSVCWPRIAKKQAGWALSRKTGNKEEFIKKRLNKIRSTIKKAFILMILLWKNLTAQ